MRVLWLCNIILPELATTFGLNKPNGGGWISRAWAEMQMENGLELGLCVPIKNPKYLRDGIFNNYKYYSFLMISNESNTNINSQKTRFKEIVNDFNPDIIHIWGTENEHTFSMVDMCRENGLIEKVVINIQGLATYIGDIYTYGLNEETITKEIGGNSIYKEALEYKHKGSFERQSLEIAQNVIGRTVWDRACTAMISPTRNYYFCRPMLREVFYKSKKWNMANCNKYQIMISQAFYPIKGLHLIIPEIAKIKGLYSSVKVRICGADPTKASSSYGEVIKKELIKYGVYDIVEFIGRKNELEMVEEYLNANVFLSPSLIENESNSICEAMLLGVPVVSSYVGGVCSVVDHCIDGYLYPLNESYMMSYYIRKVFDDKDATNEISKKAIAKAEEFVDVEIAKRELLNTYEQINS
ncbi:MAG: glycosyltransferase [Pseudobutyrivibrio sp.]|nr:glycosyltransferase [Pseudobutyrivibrio sp.]